MELKEAFALVAGVCVNARETLEGHQKIQKALAVVRGKLFPDPKNMAAPSGTVAEEDQTE